MSEGSDLINTFCKERGISGSLVTSLQGYRGRFQKKNGTLPTEVELQVQLVKLERLSEGAVKSVLNPDFNYKNTEGTWLSKMCDSFIVTRYESAKEIYIRFLEYPYEVKTTMGSVLTGNISNPYYPTVCGVACRGEVPAGSIKFKGELTIPYSKWSLMINRCYREEDDRYPFYGGKGVYVEDSWLCYANFLEWFNKLDYKVSRGYHLDKDILSSRNQEVCYSAETCCIVPQYVNQAVVFCKSAKGAAGTTLDAKGRYKAQHKNAEVPLGSHVTVGEAHSAYKADKEKYVRTVAKSAYLSGEISSYVYDALMGWEVSVYD